MIEGQNTDIHPSRIAHRLIIRKHACQSHIAKPEDIRARKLQYAAISGLHFELAERSFADWLKEMRAEVIAETTVTIAVSVGPKPWYLVRFLD